jgi:hypothetical protein
MRIALIFVLTSTLLAQDRPLRDFSEKDDAPKASEAAPPKPAAPTATSLSTKEAEMRGVAERYAPILYQRTAGTAEQRRFDYPTVFDFDGDWIGNNNWENAADPKLKVWSYVYYSVIESDDYYFLHYAFYHPRDWSTVQDRYDGVLDQLQVKYKDMVGDSMRKEAEFNHENDLEGVLIIVEKHASGGPQPVAIETIAHGHPRPRRPFPVHQTAKQPEQKPIRDFSEPDEKN